jgi:hypothetical protein
MTWSAITIVHAVRLLMEYNIVDSFICFNLQQWTVSAAQDK